MSTSIVQRIVQFLKDKLILGIPMNNQLDEFEDSIGDDQPEQVDVHVVVLQ